MISEGWAAFFPVYPAIGKRVDFNLALAGAEAAWTGRRGAWMQEGENLLLGYEFRLCVKLGKSPNATVGLDAFSRLCVDMRTDKLHDQFGLWQVPPPFRLWIWKENREKAIETLSLNT